MPKETSASVASAPRGGVLRSAGLCDYGKRWGWDRALLAYGSSQGLGITHGGMETSMERDYAFEALAEATNTDWTAGRGELNAALKSIREQSEIEDSYLLADEIYARGKMYRAVFPNAALTPTALAKHWLRVKAETSKAPRHPAPAPLPPKPPKNVNLEHAREILAMLRSQE